MYIYIYMCIRPIFENACFMRISLGPNGLPEFWASLHPLPDQFCLHGNESGVVYIIRFSDRSNYVQDDLRYCSYMMLYV
jgi:hypothetical protein